MTGKAVGYICALSAVFIWGGNFVVARGVAGLIAPVEINFWRWLLAFCCVLPFAYGKWKTDWPIIKKHLPFVIIQGIVGVALLNALFYKAGNTSSSINMVLFVPSAPIIILALSRIICGERITLYRFLGLVVILGGLLLLISRGQWSNLTNFDIHAGDLWAIGGVACFGVYTFLARYRPKELGIATLHTAIFGAGLIVSLPALLLEMQYSPPTTWNSTVIIGIFYAGVGCSCVSYLLWTKAVDNIGSVAAGIIYYLIILFTALKGVLILGEEVTLIHVIGGALMLSGIALASIIPKKTTA